MIGYQTNFEQGGCGKMQMRNSLQNSCLNGCAVVTLPVVAYLSTLYNPIKFQDQANFGIRLSLLALFTLISHLPVQFIKIEESPMGVALAHVVLPLTIFGVSLLGGPYDWILLKI